jgi:hypothetical protein
MKNHLWGCGPLRVYDTFSLKDMLQIPQLNAATVRHHLRTACCRACPDEMFAAKKVSLAHRRRPASTRSSDSITLRGDRCGPAACRSILRVRDRGGSPAPPPLRIASGKDQRTVVGSPARVRRGTAGALDRVSAPRIGRRHRERPGPGDRKSLRRLFLRARTESGRDGRLNARIVKLRFQGPFDATSAVAGATGIAPHG